MRAVRPCFDETEEDRKAADRQTTSLAGLAVALLLVVIGLFLVRELHAAAVAEDCVLTGRSNCPLVLAEARF